jgi:HD-like signal output (HDOD) protein/CheY-like chemotaxis protein
MDMTTFKPTILFVDEEKFVLKALQRSFRKMRAEWDLRFAGNPSEALAALESTPMDVIVTETVFSDQSGLDFLALVRDQHPNSVRIILSGYADHNIVLQSVDLAHQYLAKPCEDDALKATITKAFMMKKLLDNDAIKQVVSKIDSLPSVPALYMELVQELESEDASISRVGDIIAKDMGLTVKLLKLVNSSFFGLPQRVTNPAKAVSLLGTEIVKAVVLTSGTFEKFKKLKFTGFSMDRMWEHAFTCAVFAKIIAQVKSLDRKQIDTAFMAGLLHDIGILLIAAHLPDEFTRILDLVQERGATTMAEAEMEVIGTSHAAVGAYLLGLWGLPDAIIDAVAYHHTPSQKETQEIHWALITHVANGLALAGPGLATPDAVVDGIDYEYLQRSNLLPELRVWKQACARYAAEPAG